MSLVIQIGNSDDKLTQKQWAAFVLEVRDLVEQSTQIHFWGASVNYEPWQNLCCVCDPGSHNLEFVLERLTIIRKRYQQDSVAVVIGEPKFI